MMHELKDDLQNSGDHPHANYHPHSSGFIGTEVLLVEQEKYVVLDNGIVRVTITKPGGIVTGLKYGGIENLLETHNKETNRGYWDLNWSQKGGKDIFDVISGTRFKIVYKDANRVEVSFFRPYDPKSGTSIPLNIDKRFVLMRGSSGFYSYGIYERPSGWPAFNFNQTRITFKLQKDRFHYMAVADDRQRLMPCPEDLMPDRCQQLAYPEAHVLTNPCEHELCGEVDDKYQYTMDNKDMKVHGWVSANPMVGFWIISPSNEFRNGGPTKQNLTSHVGPTCLAVFQGAHYAGSDLCPSFEEGEPWQKVFGPVFIYLNSAPMGTPCPALWQNAKAQAMTEEMAWPYSWPASPDFPKAAERGTVSGRLLVSDPFQPPYVWGGKYAFLGLAAPGELGSWQTESKGYQFWTQADANGHFCIRSIRAGVYDLYGWVPGVVGDYKFEKGSIHVQPGAVIELGDITYTSPRDGPTLWEIGVPDRTANGFFVPDANPKYVNRLFLNHPQKWRQYGLWERYTDLYPTQDLVYTVGQSDWRTDWFFTHLNRFKPDGSFEPTTWEVRFQIPEVVTGSPYKLRIATAAANGAAIQLFVNKLDYRKPVFDTMQYGRDNAIARHGIHGLYKLWTIGVDPHLLRVGPNSFYLRQRKASGPFTGVMYDYLRLEAPACSPSGPALASS
ncbi:hypothetical protein M758_1G153400 [Ceratodon purpureus]|nr:hypothetical protein M758_1G153400 [Ceratodon purpureus]